MSDRSQAKRAVAVAILLWVCLWPLAHRILVATWDVNPWKLGAFAMYTTPTPPVQVVLFRKGSDGLVPIDERTLTPAARAVLDRFRVERHALGRLRRPDDVGRATLRSSPDLEWLVVAVQRMLLDLRSARMTSRRDEYVYERAE